jgi:DNA-binding Lrp family transcriptional regulator
MNLKDIKFLSEVSKETGISVRQLTRRITKLINEGKLIEFKHYKKMEGKTGTYILSKEGIEKIIGGNKCL